MANQKSKVDEWEVRDLEDNSTIRVYVEHNTEMGNNGVPGLQITSMGHITNYEPLHVERWAYAAKKAGQKEFLITDTSWTYYADTYIKNSLVIGDTLKARVEVKVRSSEKPVTKEYDLPFSINN